MRRRARASTRASLPGRELPPQWTVRYTAHSRQREQSFGTLTEAQTFQLTLSTGKQTQAGCSSTPAPAWSTWRLCDAYIDGMAKANANGKATYRSNFRNAIVVVVLRARTKSRRWTPRSRTC